MRILYFYLLNYVEQLFSFKVLNEADQKVIDLLITLSIPDDKKLWIVILDLYKLLPKTIKQYVTEIKVYLYPTMPLTYHCILHHLQYNFH